MKAIHWALGALGVGVVLLAGKKAFGYIAGKPIELSLKPIGNGQYLDAPAADAFNTMKAVALAAGVRIVPTSGFRTMEEQTKLRAEYEAGERAVAARPGYSEHQAGLAVDVETAGGTNAAYSWLRGNAARFGFFPTVASEPWHWSYRP